MIHATVELIEAMRGLAPRQTPESAGNMLHEVSPACGAGYGSNGAGQLAVRGYAGHRNSAQDTFSALHIDCPACLRLMREATDPVRWDHLETLGLAPKLEAT